MKIEDARQLLDKYINGDASQEEKRVVESWYLKLGAGETLSKEELQHEHDLGMVQLEGYFGRQRRNLVFRIAAAAAILILVAGVFLYSARPKGIKDTISVAQDIPPGKRRAQLRLATGKIIHLSESKNGISINGGRLSYDDGSELQDAETNADDAAILVANTPRGGTYDLTLSDGTVVVLNAESSLKFPQTFNGNNRSVELTGEAYFQVAKNKSMPFIVKSGAQTITVLGTHFNVNAYNATKPSTVLEEGSVRVQNGDEEVMLVPGQQADSKGSQLTVVQADMDAVLAWKQGYFRFNDESIPEIMLKISRWYDVEVKYDGEITNEVFTGAISRFSNISDVLDMLERTKIVHFKLEGRRVTVLN